MPKVYMVRHQKAGILTSHVFTKKPTAAQVAPLQAECERLHGAEINGKQAWVTIHEAELLDDGVPVFPKRDGGGLVVNTAAASQFSVSGVGTVKNPEK